MARLHLFEFEDLEGFPALLRIQMTDYLVHTTGLVRSLPGYIADLLLPALRACGTDEILDLGSGSGGILPKVARVLAEDRDHPVRVLLTDKYPHAETLAELRATAPDRLDFHPDPVDGRDVPAGLPGLRTMFLSLHHFRPEDARAILADAVRKRRSIAVFEFTERNALTLTAFILITPLAVLLLTPFMRPLRWTRLLFTYVIPVLPLLIWWDGIASHLRTYSPDELRELVAGLDAPDYRWDIRRERIPGTPANCTSLVGVPAREAAPNG